MNLLKDIVLYGEINPEVSNTAFKTFSGHTWYLSELVVAQAFFDSRISVVTKRSMVKALLTPSINPNVLKVKVLHERVKKLKMQDSVTSRTKDFFRFSELPCEFLDNDARLWFKDPSYIFSLSRIKGLLVTNDVAERYVAIGSSQADQFNGKITTDEDQFQCLLEGVPLNRKVFPKCTKGEICEGLGNIDQD